MSPLYLLAGALFSGPCGVFVTWVRFLDFHSSHNVSDF